MGLLRFGGAACYRPPAALATPHTNDGKIKTMLKVKTAFPRIE
jgi:hypothetical protein